MAVKKGQRRKQNQPVVEEIEEQPLVENRYVLLISLATLLLVLFYDFLVPRMTGDTFMTLAGGRDVFAGKLAEPDEWAFTTKGRVWINQNWGTSVLFYSSWKMIGYDGVVVIKGVAIALMALMLVLAGKQLKATTSVAMLVSSFIMLSAVNYIDMRANTIGLTFLAALMWMLYWSYGRPHRIWAVLVLIFFWSHMHGSFIFGIAVMGLWTVVVCGYPFFVHGKTDGLKQLWPLPAAVVLAIVLSVVTSPFGLMNLHLPFSYIGLFQKEDWPMPASEMNPLFHPERAGMFGLRGTLWYLFTLGWLAAPLSLRILERVVGEPAKTESHDTAFKIKWLFTLILSVITILMAFRSRRFVPISLIAFAPLMAYETQRVFNRQRLAWLCGPAFILAGLTGYALVELAPHYSEWIEPNAAKREPIDSRHIWSTAAIVLALLPWLGMLLSWLFSRMASPALRDSIASRLKWFDSRRRLAWAPVLLAGAIIFLVARLLPAQLHYHSADYPASPSYDTFRRMIHMKNFPEEALQFMVDNQISGRVLNEWRWEGFLQWENPDTKVMLGGRSRTAYSPSAAREYALAKGTKDYSVHHSKGITLMASESRLSATDRMAARLMLDKKTPWRIIYYDRFGFIAANEKLAESKKFIADAEEGRFTYPSTRSENATLAARLLAFSSDATTDEIIEASRAAHAEVPITSLYEVLLYREQNGLIDREKAFSFVLSEAIRLADKEYHQPEGLQFLISRKFLADQLATLYSRLAPLHKDRQAFWRKNSQQIQAAATALMNREPEPSIDPIPEEFKTLQ